MAVTSPLVNGKRHSFASVELTVVNGGDSRTFRNIKAITYSSTLEPGVERGASPFILGDTVGDYEAEGSMEFSNLDAARDFLAFLGDGYMVKKFQITVSYAAQGSDTHTDDLLGCRIKGHESGGEQGPDPLTEVFPLFITEIRPDGLRPVADEEPSA